MRALALALVCGLSLGAACKRDPSTGTAGAAPALPTVRLYLLSTVAGAIEPCGCQKDMLGGIDHAASFVRSEKEKAPHALVLGAGPMLFMDPVLEAQRERQDRWKAEALAAGLGELPLSAWAPGANDFAAGTAQLGVLAHRANAVLLAANLRAPHVEKSKTFDLQGHKVGVTGVADARSPLGHPPGVESAELERSLAEGLEDLKRVGAKVRVALVSADRGQALRLAEAVPGFHVMVVGKAFDRGEGNDPPFAPVLVDGTLVVQTPNHLQAIAVVDLHVRDGYVFHDGSGITQADERDAMEGRIRAVEARLARADPKVDSTALRGELRRLKEGLAALAPAGPPKGKSYMTYELTLVRERLGKDPGVKERLSDYYRRVNEHNREAFKDRKPPDVPPGQSHYIGAESCSNCHEEAYAFWQKTPHAKAYETLTSQHKEFNLDCVSCHVTGYEKPGGSTVTHVKGLTAVQCETCHGPGSRHEDTTDTADIVAHPEKSLCATCHHPPHVGEDWSVDEAFPQILGKGHGG